MKKLTAVEWLIKQFSDNGSICLQDYLEAKKLEREQIINAYNHGTFFLRGEDYYKKHFEDESGI